MLVVKLFRFFTAETLRRQVRGVYFSFFVFSPQRHQDAESAEYFFILRSSVFGLPSPVSRLRSPVFGLPSSVSGLPSSVHRLPSLLTFNF